MTSELHETVGPSATRRGFLKTAAAGGAAYATTSTLVGTAAADGFGETLTGTVKDAVVATSPAAYGVDYLMGTDYTSEAQTRIANYAHRRYGDMRDYGGYTGGDALVTEIESGVTEMQLSDEQIMTTIQNNVEAADNVAYSKGQMTVAEALNAGKSESTAKSEMETAIDEYFAKIQENLINHWNTQQEQFSHHMAEINAHTDTNSSTYFVIMVDNGNNAKGEPSFSEAAYRNVDKTLLDGRTVQYGVSVVEYSGYYYFSDPWRNLQSEYTMGNNTSDHEQWYFYPNGDTSYPGSYTELENAGHPTYIHNEDFKAVWDSVVTTRDNVFSDLSGYVTDVYSAYSSGDLDLTDVVDPTTFATEAAQNNNDEAFRQAAAAQGGFPTAATENVVITITTTDTDGNEVSETIRTDLYTNHVPTDSSGNEVGFEVGQSYDPSSWSEPLFITFRESDDAPQEMSKLEEQFLIEEAYDPDGNNVTSFTVDDTTTHTSDVQELQNELDDLREEQLRLQEQAENTTPDTTTGAGGGASGGLLNWMDNTLGIGPIPGRAVGLGSVAAAGYGVYSSTVSAASNAGPSINVGGKGPDE